MKYSATYIMRKERRMFLTVVFFPKTISAWNWLAFAEAPSLAVFRSFFLNNLPEEY